METKVIATTATNLLLGMGETSGLPVKWPGKRFDLVWILDRADEGWRFSQIGQLLLPGDTRPAVDGSEGLSAPKKLNASS
jgi:hypothetical protein